MGWDRSKKKKIHWVRWERLSPFNFWKGITKKWNMFEKGINLILGDGSTILGLLDGGESFLVVAFQRSKQWSITRMPGHTSLGESMASLGYHIEKKYTGLGGGPILDLNGRHNVF